MELVEKNNETGGNLNNWYQLFPDRKFAKDLNDILKQNLNHPKIQLHLGMEPRKIGEEQEGKFLVPLSDGSLLEGDTAIGFHWLQNFRCPPEEEYGYGIYEKRDHFRGTGKYVLQPFDQNGKQEYPQTYQDHPLRGFP